MKLEIAAKAAATPPAHGNDAFVLGLVPAFPSLGCTAALLNPTQALTLFCSQLFLIHVVLVICFIAQGQDW